MPTLRIAAIFALVAGLAGCQSDEKTDVVFEHDGGTLTSGIRRVRCDRAIQFQANRVKISGIEVPFQDVGGLIKVGEVDVEPKVLRAASDLIQFLDTVHYVYCKDMLLAASKDERRELREKRDKAMLLLADTLKVLQGSKNASEYATAVEKQGAAAASQIGYKGPAAPSLESDFEQPATTRPTR